jgi:hypothetical protein
VGHPCVRRFERDCGLLQGYRKELRG